MQRGMDYYKKKGYSDEWIYQRLLSIKIRHELTDEWKSRGVSTSKEYAILTDEMCKAWSDLQRNSLYCNENETKTNTLQIRFIDNNNFVILIS